MSISPRQSSVWQRLRAALLRVDSVLDDGWHRFWSGFGDVTEAMARFSQRLHVGGWKRAAFEFAGEGFTLGLAGLVVLLALGQPAFRETEGDWLKKADLAVTFLDRYGNIIGQRGILHDDAVALEDMPDYVIKAVLSTEDRRFYEHFGIDVPGTLRALVVNAQANTVVQGGSSITQQLAKNLFLSNERTLQRKIKEAYLSLWLEFHLTKDQILKLYLDRAYMGGGAFGIEAASQFYFGKSVRDITLPEAAMLAGLFKAPTRFAPHVNIAAARARANTVLSNMVEAGFMTEGQVWSARRNPATPVDRSVMPAPDFYLDWAYQVVSAQAEAGKFGDAAVLVVRTPFDPNIQRQAEETVESMLREHGQDFNVDQGAIVVMEPDGGVRAMVGGRDYGQSQFNRATDALRQPGSSFKPFVYATAFMNGYRPDSIVPDRPICISNWCPQNYNRSYAGNVTLSTALVRSINTIPVRLSVQMGESARDGREKIIDVAHRMGVETPLKASWALPIGVEGMNLLELTAAYGVFASGGYKATPHAALEVRDGRGALLYTFDRAREDPLVMNPGIMADINPILNLVVEQGTARRAQLPGIKAAGKTGTTNSYRDAWFIGFTGNLVAGVWYGNDDYQPTNKMTGGSLPAMTWQAVMASAHAGLDIKPIPGVAPFPPAEAPVEVSEVDAAASVPQVVVTGMPTGTVEALREIARLMEEASTSLAARSRTATLSAPDGGGVTRWVDGRWQVR